MRLERVQIIILDGHIENAVSILSPSYPFSLSPMAPFNEVEPIYWHSIHPLYCS